MLGYHVQPSVGSALQKAMQPSVSAVDLGWSLYPLTPNRSMETWK